MSISPYNYTPCNSTWTRLIATVSAHIAKIHEGKRSFKCEKCEVTFKNSSHLTRHVNSVHEGKKLFNCSDCEKKFRCEIFGFFHLLFPQNERKIFKLRQLCLSQFV